MHWSRLVDVPIAGLIVLLRPILGTGNAEYAAAILVPLLTFGIVMALYAAIARRLFGRHAALVAAITLFLIWPVRAQLLPLRIDHHGWQIVTFLAATLCLFDRRRSLASAAIMGVALALWVEISVEGLPFAALFLGVFGLQWLKTSPDDRRDHWRFPVALIAFALSAISFFSITENWLTVGDHCDALSPFHLAAFGGMAIILAAGALALERWPIRSSLATKIAIGGCALLACAAIWWSIAPQCLGDAFGGLDPLVRKYWYVRVYEGLPLWLVPREDAVAPALALVVGLGLLLVWLWRGLAVRSEDKWSLAVLYIGCVIAGALVTRTTVYALLISGMFVAWGAVAMFRSAERQPGLATRMGLRALAVVLAMNYVFAQNVSDRVSGNAENGNVVPTSKQAEEIRFKNAVRTCQNYRAAQALNALPPSRLMAGLDSSPSILQFTRHKVVATGHHRNDQAMADVIRTFLSNPDDAKIILHARKIDYVVTCLGSYELRLYAQEAPGGLAAMLAGGNAPVWLVPQRDVGPFHIWRADWTRR